MTTIVRENPRDAPDYQIRNGRLFRHVLHQLNFKDTPTEEQWKECVPRDEREIILQRYHDTPTAGHMGIAKTIARIAQNYFWPGMHREIARYV